MMNYWMMMILLTDLVSSRCKSRGDTGSGIIGGCGVTEDGVGVVPADGVVVAVTEAALSEFSLVLLS